MLTVRIVLGLAVLAALIAPCRTPADSAGVPFRLERHRVFVPVQVGEAPPLSLFLDTGLTYPGIFLFHERFIDSLDLPERIEVLVPGAGDDEPSKAILADSMDLRLGDTILPMQWVVISKSERTQGFSSDGIIGGTLFMEFMVEIDYGDLLLRLHDPGSFAKDASWTSLPIELKKGIPWLGVMVSESGREAQALQVYIDLADDFPLTLLTGEGRRFAAPAHLDEAYLGTGLSGDIRGKIGEVASLRIGPYELTRLRTAYAPAGTRSKQDGADAILGNGLLENFHVVFDYAGKQLLLKPNDRFGNPFD